MVLASVFRELAENAAAGLQLAAADRPQAGGASGGAPDGRGHQDAKKTGAPGKGPSPMEMDQLARQVYRIVKQKLIVERERKGGF
jgi:hypothetical protein